MLLTPVAQALLLHVTSHHGVFRSKGTGGEQHELDVGWRTADDGGQFAERHGAVGAASDGREKDQ